jgi:hypothetical protein
MQQDCLNSAFARPVTMTAEKRIVNTRQPGFKPDGRAGDYHS